MLSLEVEHLQRESTYGGQVNPSEIGYSPDDRDDLPELGYSPDGPVTKLIKEMPKREPYVDSRLRRSTSKLYIWLMFGHFGLINLVRRPSGE